MASYMDSTIFSLQQKNILMLFQHTISTLPFKQWIWKDAENKKLFWISLAVMIVSFTWMKIVYPYPNFMPPDSNSYIQAAQDNLFINQWPIGYSKFLRLVSSFSQSHFVLVLLQYILLLTSILYFLFSIRYLLSPGKWIFRIILVLSIANPLLPHISNFVSSDSLFAALSLAWFTQLLWMLVSPSNKLLSVHAAVLLMAFMVRFTALYYPIISIILILIKRMPARTKYYGIGAICLLLFAFIGCTQYEYKIKTDTIQYSAFGGWQIAANALYGYAYSNPDDPNTVPGKFYQLHTLVNHHLDSVKHLIHRPDDGVGIYYLWDFKSPLVIFFKQQWKGNKNVNNYFKNWARIAPLYQEYGRWLIMNHPKEFIQYYLWPNLLRYYCPPEGFMGYYNLGRETVEPIATNWFAWKNNQLPLRSKERKIHIATMFPTILAIINPLFLLAVIVFVIFGGFNKIHIISKNVLIVMLLIWISNVTFSVFSAPIELRYQLFPIVITLAFCGLLITSIIQSLQTESYEKQPLAISISKSIT